MENVDEEKKTQTVVPTNDDTLTPLSQHYDGKIDGNVQTIEDIEFTWKDLSYSVQDPKDKKAMRTLLQGMNGVVKSGQVVAIMGSSGAGKSTLLNVLAGRVGNGKIDGNILVNGSPRVAESWRKLCAYVEQDDLYLNIHHLFTNSMFANLSVAETLTYAALLRLPRKLSRKEKIQRVDDLIMELGLDNCRNTWIGSPETRGISGGERKRVSIGIELVSQPRILFLDEPTSGLDSFTAFNIISTIKNLAITRNKIVLMTIHQPRTDILDLFDKVILLSAGKLIWCGTVTDALVHFEMLGFKLPPKTNPSDFFLDIITLDQRSSELRAASDARITLFQESWVKYGVIEESKKEYKDNGLGGITTSWPSSWAGEFFTLLNRNLKDVLRDKASLGATIGQGIFLTLIMGFIFFKLDLDAAGVQSRIGIVMPTLGVFPIQRNIIKRERAAGTYRASAAFLAKLVSTLPLVAAGALILAIPVYWMIGLQPDINKYFTFILIILVHSFAANALGLAIGSVVPTVQVGQIIGPLVIVIFLLFGGQLLNLDKVPSVFRWIQYISIISYSNKALNQNEFNGLTNFAPCPPPANGVISICYTSGEQVLSTFGLNTPYLYNCIAINAGISCGLLALGFLFFTRSSAPQLRLK